MWCLGDLPVFGVAFLLLPLGSWNFLHVCKMWGETHIVLELFSIGEIVFLKYSFRENLKAS